MFFVQEILLTDWSKYWLSFVFIINLVNFRKKNLGQFAIFLDGWLINIENKIEAEQLDNLEYFLKELHRKIHIDVKGHPQIIWYDSVTKNGELKWQNALNELNKFLFQSFMN